MLTHNHCSFNDFSGRTLVRGFYHPFPLISLEISLMTRSPYPTGLTDAQWAILAPMIPAPHKRSRPRKADMREVVNAILYLVRGGNSWRAIRRDG